DQLALDLGDIHASGAFRLTAGTPLALALKLRLNTFDADRFLAERARGGAAAPAATGASLWPKPPASGNALHFSLPPDLAASLDLGLDALLWRQGVLRQLHLEAELKDGKLAIGRLGALLPGGSDV